MQLDHSATGSNSVLCEKCPVFAESVMQVLRRDELAKLEETSIRISYAKGRRIADPREGVPGVLCVKSGIVKLTSESAEGNSVTFGYRSEGDLIGCDSLYATERIISAETVTPVESCFVPLTAFSALLQSNFALMRRINESLANTLTETVRHMRDNLTKNVEQRIAQTIIDLEQKFGTDAEGFIALPLSRKDLSEILGSSIESVFRGLASLKGKGCIDVRKLKVRIIDRHQLDAICING
jgi:CRP-like cAMP-binding protein